MGRVDIRVFDCEFDTADEIREKLIMKFPGFLANCNKDRATHYLSYTDLGNARFEKAHAMSIRDFISATFYNPDKTKHTRRKLGASESDDT